MTTRRRHTVDSEFIVGPDQRGQRGWTVTQAPATPAGPIPREMTCRDRTTEFFSAIKSLQSRQGNGVITNHRQQHPRQQHTEFMQKAKRIGQDLSNTFAKLEKLTLLAKKKSLFDDKSVEIQELTYIIKQDINSLNKQIAQLQDFVKQRRSQNGHLQTQTHSNTVVLSLQSKLANMSNAFKNVLEVRTQNLKEQKDRREHFSQGSVTSSLPPAAAAMNGGSLLNQDVALDMSAFEDGPRHRAHGQQEMQMVQQDDSYIKEREETMHSIESTIVELSGIFQQLAHMVKEQEEQVQRIDHNVEETSMNVEAAHGEILKYFQSVTSNRWLMIKVFVVLIVFFIIFIVFLA